MEGSVFLTDDRDWAIEVEIGSIGIVPPISPHLLSPDEKLRQIHPHAIACETPHLAGEVSFWGLLECLPMFLALDEDMGLHGDENGFAIIPPISPQLSTLRKEVLLSSPPHFR